MKMLKESELSKILGDGDGAVSKEETTAHLGVIVGHRIVVPPQGPSAHIMASPSRVTCRTEPLFSKFHHGIMFSAVAIPFPPFVSRKCLCGSRASVSTRAASVAKASICEERDSGGRLIVARRRLTSSTQKAISASTSTPMGACCACPGSERTADIRASGHRHRRERSEDAGGEARGSLTVHMQTTLRKSSASFGLAMSQDLLYPGLKSIPEGTFGRLQVNPRTELVIESSDSRSPSDGRFQPQSSGNRRRPISRRSSPKRHRGAAVGRGPSGRAALGRRAPVR